MKTAMDSSEKMQLHPVTLVFQGSQAYLEKQFLEDYSISSLPIVRFSCFVGLLIYGLFGILDAYLIPEQKNIFWLYRYAVFCPLSIGVYLFSYSPLFKKMQQLVVSIWGIFAGVGIVMMITLSKPPVSFSYYAGLILVFMMGYSVVKLRFVWATATCWILVILYEYAAIVLIETPMQILVNNNFFFIGANLIGMISCYAMEYYARRDFYLKILLHDEREKVHKAHDILEERVEDRTTQLLEANTRITQEMEERLQVEEERRKIQTKLIRHQKMESLGLMAGGVAHDLNNILSGVISYPELLLMDLPSDSKMKKPLEQILESGQRAAAVVADLLTVARGIASLHEVVAINDLVETYIKSPEYKIQESYYPKISVQLELRDDLPMCKCSPVHIQKVLMNLVNNAFEAIEINGTILISTFIQIIESGASKASLLDAGEYIVLQISDSGTGIPEETLQHIFEPFYTKKVMGRSGTGLGLAVVWSTMQEHRGTIDVTSDENGTVFSCFFPITAENRVQEKDEKQENLKGTASILVVDDERVQRDICSTILIKLGYKVYTVNSGEEAVTFLEKKSVDLLVLDMLMDPGMNGKQTYEAVSCLNSTQKAIIVSGFSKDDEVQAALGLGISHYLKKPYSIEQLGLVVKQALQ